jgi:hypothetical protein
VPSLPVRPLKGEVTSELNQAYILLAGAAAGAGAAAATGAAGAATTFLAIAFFTAFFAACGTN